MKTIGFAGTAKNTGKTTTAAKVLSALRENGARIAITSIGYDGESVDNVTGLPKPLYYLKAGDIIATAEQCLKVTKTGDTRLLENTGIQTILGEILIVEIVENRTYTLAGPNRRTDLEKVLARLEVLQADVTLIDGALNRIVPMICADGIVISTGASYDEEIGATAEHVEGIAYLFTFGRVADAEKYKTIHLHMEDGEVVEIASTSLITAESFEKIKAHLHRPIRRLTIPGACYPGLLDDVFKLLVNTYLMKELVLGNPLFLIASGNPVEWQQVLSKFVQHGVKVGYSETLPLQLITVSPFYPRYIQKSHSYEPAYVNARVLLEEIRARVHARTPHVPVIDVEEISQSALLATIL